MKNPSRTNYAQIILSIAAGLVLLLALYFIFVGRIVLPQSFVIGGLSIRLYGICLAVAAIVGYGLVMRRRNAYNISESQAEAVILTLLISGFIGARFYHVASELPYYLEHPNLIPAVWRGGLSIFGAMIGGVIGLWVYLKFITTQDQFSWQKLSNILDWLVPGLAIGQAIGRFGNLLNYEVYGYPTSLPWKMYVPPHFRIPPYESAHYFHPLFLYESLASLIIVIVLLKLSPKYRYGSLFFLWLFLYNGVRFFLEGLRIDSVMVAGFRLNRLVALALSLIGLAAFQYITKPDVDKNSLNS